MYVETELIHRAESKCELCGTAKELSVYTVGPREAGSVDDSALICRPCQTQMDDIAALDVNHWRCLNDSIWNPNPAVQVLAWRMLKKLDGQGERWAQNALDSLYLDDEVLDWAQAGQKNDEQTSDIQHLDCNGVTLSAGDTVSLTKDLNVKGANFTAKRGTAVRGISLVSDNAQHIEGRINGQRIVILTQFVKKA